MMYWIASYPRSGNTFLRILFQEVYGIYTWEGYGDESPQKVLKLRSKKQSDARVFIKTHELPNNTSIDVKTFKSIYLIRDGRDAAVSMSHHRSQIVKPGSDYLFNLRTSILAPFGTSFGGWSKHVKQWSQISDVIIKFEDLISNPIQELKKLEKIIDLPKADYSKIPSFTDLQTKKYSLGSGNDKLSKSQQKKRREKFFRSGKINTWKSEIPQNLQHVFHSKHGKYLKKHHYTSIQSNRFVVVKYLKEYWLWLLGLIKETLLKK